MSDDQRPLLTAQQGSILASLHLGEYSALTMRATYNEAFCTALWGLMGGFLTFAAAVWPHVENKLALVWLALIAVEVIACWIAGFILDQYVMVLYIEKSLRPLVASHLETRGDFWQWERFLASRRGDKTPFFWEGGSAAFVLTGLIGQIVWRFIAHVQISRWDFAIVPAVGLFFLLCLLAKSTTKTRREWIAWNAQEGKLNPATPPRIGSQPPQ